MKTKWDQLKDDIQRLTTESAIMKLELAPVFKFLQWKLKFYPEKFTDEDKDTIKSKNIIGYTELSSIACSYTKPMIQKYTESLWQSTINNQYIADGHPNIPQVSCDKLPIPPYIDRNMETLLLSHFYNNNLMNEYLFRIGHHETVSPMCPCKVANQTPYHCLLQCELVDTNIGHELKDGIDTFYKEHPNMMNSSTHDHITLLNMSRNKCILELMLKAIKSNKTKYRTKIVLNKKTSTSDDTT